MKAARADYQLAWTVTVTLFTFLMAIYTSGCTPKQPPQQPPTLSQRLDALYQSDRGAWRAEVERLLTAGNGVAIPPRHLARAIDAFNDQTTRSLCMTATSSYIKARITPGGTLATEADRELLKAYAEMALTSADPGTAQELRDICARADREQVCRGRF